MIFCWHGPGLSFTVLTFCCYRSFFVLHSFHSCMHKSTLRRKHALFFLQFLKKCDFLRNSSCKIMEEKWLWEKFSLKNSKKQGGKKTIFWRYPDEFWQYVDINASNGPCIILPSKVLESCLFSFGEHFFFRKIFFLLKKKTMKIFSLFASDLTVSEY